MTVQDRFSPLVIHPNVLNTDRKSAPSFSSVRNWAAEFECGCQHLDNNRPNGRPSTATTDRIHREST